MLNTNLWERFLIQLCKVQHSKDNFFYHFRLLRRRHKATRANPAI